LKSLFPMLANKIVIAIMGEFDVHVVSATVQGFLKERIVKVHLYKHGFKPYYWVWEDHGEQRLEGDLDNVNTCMGLVKDGGHGHSQNDQFMSMQDMVHDALGQPDSFQPATSIKMEEAPNEETQKFYNMEEAPKLVLEALLVQTLLSSNIFSQTTNPNLAFLVHRYTSYNNFIPLER